MNRKSLLFLFSVLLLTEAVGSSSAQSRTGSGSLTGTAVDASRAILPGALIELQPLGKKAVTDNQGHFRIADLAPGKCTLSVSYVGFAPLSVPVEIESGENTDKEAQLAIASEVDEVIVSGEQLHGQAEAINIQRTAENIVQVLPAQVITSLPNTNVADAVGRLPSVTLERDEGEGKYVQIRGTEPRLCNTTIDGVNVPSPEGTVRNIKLDVIPSDLVDRIEVNKTLSANQDADAIGGSVNLVTKSAGNRPTYTVGIQGGYTPIQGGRPLDAFNGTAGRRFGATKHIGSLLGATYDYNGRGIDDLEPSPGIGQAVAQDGTPVGNPFAYFSTIDLRTYKYDRTRYGFGGGLDFVITPNATAYVKGLLSDFHDYGDTWVYSPNTGNSIKSVNGPIVSFYNAADCLPVNQLNQQINPGSADVCTTGFMKYRHYIRRPDQQIFSVLSGVAQTFGTTVITYEISGSRSHNIGGQDFPKTRFAGPSGIDFNQDNTDPYRPKLNVQDGTNIYDPTQYTLTKTIFPRQHSTQLNFQGSADLQHAYSVGPHYGSFQFGLKIRNAHKTQNENDQIFDNPTGTITLAQALGTYTNPSYYDKSYQFGRTSDYVKLNALFKSNPGALGAVDLAAGANNALPAIFDATERVYAGYGMNTITYRRFNLQAGLRVEATDSTYGANLVTQDPNNPNNPSQVIVTPVKGNSGYINLLPSIQAQIRIDANTTLRATYGRGISRPNFSDIVPSQQVDPNTTPPSLVQGNPNLKPTSANNYDALAEHFFHPLGVLQAGFFYKDLSNPIYPTSATEVGGQFPGYRINQSINGPNGHIAGFETAWEQRLSMLPGFLNGFGVSANYSYTTSKVSFPDPLTAPFNGGRTDHPHLQRQAPNTYNLGMTYDKTRFSMRFDMSHNDANIYSYNYSVSDPTVINDPILGLKGPTGDVYLYAHTQYDVQGSYRLARGFSAVVSGLNLSNEVFGFYQGSPIYPIQREYYHPSVIFGLRWTSSAE